MWTCPNCKRIFQKNNQPHSCKSIPVEQHFKNKPLAKEIYDELFKRVSSEVGESKEISLPCCIHWFGKYDYIALLPKKDKLEIHIAADINMDIPNSCASTQTSKATQLSLLLLKNIDEIDEDIISCIDAAYHLKDNEIK